MSDNASSAGLLLVLVIVWVFGVFIGFGFGVQTTGEEIASCRGEFATDSTEADSVRTALNGNATCKLLLEAPK